METLIIIIVVQHMFSLLLINLFNMKRRIWIRTNSFQRRILCTFWPVQLNIQYCRKIVFLQISVIFRTRYNTTEKNLFVNSDIVSMRLKKIPQQSFKNLDPPVHLTFTLKNVGFCVFIALRYLNNGLHWHVGHRQFVL